MFSVTGLIVPEGAVWEYGTPSLGWFSLPLNASLSGIREKSIEEKLDRREGKGRRWLGDVLECCTNYLAGRMI